MTGIENLATCVVAFGSPHGDDQVGWEVGQKLRFELEGTRPDLHLVVASTPWDLMAYIDPSVRLVLVDACQTGAAPGSVHHLESADRPPLTRTCSSHSVTLDHLLQLAESLGRVPHELIILGIEIQSTDPGQSLSPAVAAAVPVAVDRIKAAIESR